MWGCPGGEPAIVGTRGPVLPLPSPDVESTTRNRNRTLLLVAAPPLYLGAALLGAWIVIARPVAVLGWLLAALVAVPVLWVLVSALWPARAERGCPACGRDALARIDPETTQGLVCRACGWRDESASGWLLAEEEGPLEDIVLAQRARRPGEPTATRAPRSSADGGASDTRWQH